MSLNCWYCGHFVKKAKQVYNKITKFSSGSIVKTNKGVKVVQGTGSNGYFIDLFKPRLLLQPNGIVFDTDNTTVNTCCSFTTNDDYLSTNGDFNTLADTYIVRKSKRKYLDFKTWVMWLKILESRAELKRMWFKSLRAKLMLYQYDGVNNTFRNRRILRCNRRGIGLRSRHDQ